MGSKADKFYFNNFLSATECCVEAAKYLEECLDNLKSKGIEINIKE